MLANLSDYAHLLSRPGCQQSQVYFGEVEKHTILPGPFSELLLYSACYWATKEYFSP